MSNDLFDKTIEEVTLRLPNLPKQAPKNLFDILGVRNKETINSRALAYFLNSNETHSLKTLFFDSLIAVISSKKHHSSNFIDGFSGQYHIRTEDTTVFANKETKKRIDISILGKGWGIIIENKLYHNLINPLKAYWQHTQQSCNENIIGIILTLFPTKDEKIIIEIGNKKATYINITHKEWIDEVQNQLNLSDVKNIEGLLYLKEYIKTIESHYTSKMDEPTYNALVSSITKHKKEVKEIQQKVTESAEFLQQQTEEVFESFGYEKTGNYFINRKLEHPCYFYLPNTIELLETNKLWFCLEFRNELNKRLQEKDKAKEIKSYFKPLFEHHKHLRIGGQIRKNHTHIAFYSISNVLNEENNFKAVLTKALEDCFMGNNGLINETQKFINDVLNAKE